MKASTAEPSTFEVQIQEALIFILSHLPDYRVNQNDVFLGAAELISNQNGRTNEGIVAILELMQAMPRYYGVQRKKKFWSICRRYITDEQKLLWGYLSWVPLYITDNQRRELRCYLLQQGFKELDVDQALKRFRRRIPAGGGDYLW